MRRSAAATLLTLTCISALPRAAFAADEEFYRGKTVRLVVGTIAGGGYDANGRLVARHLPRHLPGSPTIIVTNMPGASGINSVNNLYMVAPRDGTVIATFNSAIPFYQAIGTPGVQYDARALSWIGSLSQNANVIVVSRETGVRSLEDATRQEIVMGALTDGGTMGAYPLLLNNLFGTRFKVVSGYAGGNEVNLAMERGEVQGRGTTPWSTWKTTRPDWVKEGRIVALVQIGPKKDPDLLQVPLLDELARDEEQRQMFRLLGGNTYIERPFAGPPQLPPERLALLRQAFDRMTRDPAFLAEAAQEQADVDPQTGAEVERLVAAIVTTPRDVIDKVKAVTGIK